MTDHTASRRHMLDSQIRTAGVINPGILRSFETVPREKFVPTALRDVAYADDDISIGGGRFLLEPIVHSKMIEAAAPKPNDVVLDIGGGTGYSAAILAPMVMTVIALEEDQKFLERAAQLWTELEASNVVGVQGRLSKGDPENVPFSLIIINGAVEEIPAEIAAQLAPDGRLLAIIKAPGAVLGHVTLARSLGGGRFSTYNLFSAGSPYLPGFEHKPAFVF